jgi:hypothetical protein
VHPARIQFPGPHIGLCVSDVARSRRFFIEQLGFLPDSIIDLPGVAAQKLLRLPTCESLHAEYLWCEGFCLELLSYEGTGRTMESCSSGSPPARARSARVGGNGGPPCRTSS